MNFLENGYPSTTPSNTCNVLQFKQGLCVKLQHKEETCVFVYLRWQQCNDGLCVDGKTDGTEGDCVGEIWQCRLCVHCESKTLFITRRAATSQTNRRWCCGFEYVAWPLTIVKFSLCLLLGKGMEIHLRPEVILMRNLWNVLHGLTYRVH